VRILLVELFVRENAPGGDACAEAVRIILRETPHLVKARSAATAAATCVFRARLAEAFGVRGFYHSIIPGKGQPLHALLAAAFPRAFQAYRDYGFSGELHAADQAVREALDRLADAGLGNDIDSTVVEPAVSMISNALSTVRDAFEAMAGGEWRAALSRAMVFAEAHLMSYNLHVWGVPDAIVEDPVGGLAVVVEWKSYVPEGAAAARVEAEDIAQAITYAMLEAERLYYRPTPLYYEHPGPRWTVNDYVDRILGSPPNGRGARIIPVIIRRLVRPTPASPVTIPHPLLCRGARRSARKCEYEWLRELIARIVLAAEHLALSVTNIEHYLRRILKGIIPESSCRGPDNRLVPRRVPRVSLWGQDITLPRGRPLARPPRYPCKVCPDEARVVCEFYVSRGGNLSYSLSNQQLAMLLREALERVRREAWRARFALFKERENALRPYKLYRERALLHGVNGDWIRGRIDTRLIDGGRLDFFDEARVDVASGELELSRPVTRWEKDHEIVVTLREGKPATVLLREEHVRDPLLRVGFHGVVSEVDYDFSQGRLVVRVRAPNNPSRLQVLVLDELRAQQQAYFQGVVAFESNVDLTQIELQGIAAAEIGTIARIQAIARASSAQSSEDILAALFGGLRIPGGGGSYG